MLQVDQILEVDDDVALERRLRELAKKMPVLLYTSQERADYLIEQNEHTKLIDENVNPDELRDLGALKSQTSY